MTDDDASTWRDLTDEAHPRQLPSGCRLPSRKAATPTACCTLLGRRPSRT